MGARTLTQNSDISLKLAIRKSFLKDVTDYAVLDLFSGVGKMYRALYKDKAYRYVGVDNTYTHSEELCVKQDNMEYVRQNELNFDVFDLDDFGCPWELLLLCFSKLTPREAPYIFFVTDGLVYKARKTNVVIPIVANMECISRKSQIFGLNHWVIDLFKSMLFKASEKYALNITNIQHVRNHRKTCDYWGFKVVKRGEV